MKENMKDSDFWQQWLEKYKSFSCLWNKKVQTSPRKKLLAWNELIEMAKSLDKTANAFYVRARLRKFIYKHKLESKKVEVAKANGISYESKTFYYKIFKSIQEANDERQLCDQPTKNMDNKTVYQKLWRKVLTLYVSYKRLWDRNSYSTKDRMKDWKKLTKTARECYPDLSVSAFKARIRNCRNIYLKELKKLNAAEKNGLKYEPKLFYFDILNQLKQQDGSPNLEQSDDSIQTIDDRPNEEEKAEKLRNIQPMKYMRWSGDKQIWRKILKRYVTTECLWEGEHQQKYTTAQRVAAWQELLRTMQKYNPEVDLAYLKKRINSSRGIFKREFNRVKYEKQHGREYQSKLFYYDILCVLYQKDGSKIEFSTDESSDDENETSEECKKPAKYAALEAELKEKNFIYAPLKLNPKYFERKVWLDVIKKYIFCECLWNTENRDYYNLDERHHAWEKLTEIAKKIDKNADVTYVKRRMKHSRSVYVRILKLAQEAKQKGLPYDIKLYYFNALSPIYQKNFPILNYDNDDVVIDKNALECKSALNPTSNTYFPDDDEDNDFDQYAENNCDNSEFTTLTESEEILDFNIESLDSFDEGDVEQKPNVETLRLLENEVKFDDGMLDESNEPTVARAPNHQSYDETRNESNESSEFYNIQQVIKIEANPAVVETNEHFVGGNGFETFEKKIAQHLESMDDDQYLLAEKFISDVCISGRQNELTRKSCILLGKTPAKIRQK